MKRLFLDDSRNPGTCCNYMREFGVDCKIYKKDWVVVRNYDQFVSYTIENGLPDIISFDHDLADINYNPKTGKIGKGIPWTQARREAQLNRHKNENNQIYLH